MSTAGRAPRPQPDPTDQRHPAPSPQEILTLAAGSVSVAPRTQNILKRYLAEGPVTEGEWTYDRLLTIPGFGQRALDDVVAALGGRRGPPPAQPANRRSHRYLEDEIAEVLATRQRRGGWIPTPLLDRALEVIGERLPASELELSRRVVAAGLTRAPVDLGRIERAARFRDTPPPFSVLRRDGFVIAVPSGKLTLAASIHGLAVRAVVNWGLALVARTGFLAGADDLTFVSAVLEAKASFRWLDDRLGWFWFQSDRSPLVRAIVKVLQVAGAADLDDLSEALFRRWAPENVPSRRAVQTLCGQLPVFRVRRGTVSLAVRNETSALSPADETVVSLFERFGPLVEGHRLPDIALAVGMGCTQLGRALRASPFVLESRPGLFRLVGVAERGSRALRAG
jgi:hypothetical protein